MKIEAVIDAVSERARARHLLATEVQHLLGLLDAADEAASNGQPAKCTKFLRTISAQNGISHSISWVSLMPPMRLPAMVSLQSAQNPYALFLLRMASATASPGSP